MSQRAWMKKIIYGPRNLGLARTRGAFRLRRYRRQCVAPSSPLWSVVVKLFAQTSTANSGEAVATTSMATLRDFIVTYGTSRGETRTRKLVVLLLPMVYPLRSMTVPWTTASQAASL